MAFGMYTAVGFTNDPADIEIHVVQHAPDRDVHINIDRLSVLVDSATARKLRDGLNDLELDEAVS